MKMRKTLALPVLLAMLASGCPDGAAEEAGEAVDEAAEDIGEAVDDATD